MLSILSSCYDYEISACSPGLNMLLLSQYPHLIYPLSNYQETFQYLYPHPKSGQPWNRSHKLKTHHPCTELETKSCLFNIFVKTHKRNWRALLATSFFMISEDLPNTEATFTQEKASLMLIKVAFPKLRSVVSFKDLSAKFWSKTEQDVKLWDLKQVFWFLDRKRSFPTRYDYQGFIKIYHIKYHA